MAIIRRFLSPSHHLALGLRIVAVRGCRLIVLHQGEDPVRILLIDDDPRFTLHMRAVKPQDIELDTAGGTFEAFRSLRTRTPDAIILDLHMRPVLGQDEASEGLAVLGAVVGGHRGRIPVVVATEHITPALEQWALQLGAVALCSKADGLTRIFDTTRSAVCAPEAQQVHNESHGIQESE